MEKMITEVSKLKPGRYMMIEDIPCRITDMVHSKAGKHGGAKFRIEGVGIFEGTKRSMICIAGAKVEVPVINKRTAQVLTVLPSGVQMMDSESFETFELPMPEEEDIKALIREGAEVMYIDVGGRKKIMQAKGGD